MKVHITNKQALERYPVEYAKAIGALKKKKCSDDEIENAEWNYDYGVRIDNDVPPDNLKDYIEFRKSKVGISLNVEVGRKHQHIDISNYPYPLEFIEDFNQEWNLQKLEHDLEKERTENLDSILQAVNKNGTAKPEIEQEPFHVGNGIQMMQHFMRSQLFERPEYPSLDDLKTVKPEIYQQYLEMCDGTKLVSFHPWHKECDKWGFIIDNLIAVSKRLNKPQNEGIHNRYITSDLNGSSFYYIDDGKISWQGSLNSANKHVTAVPGTEFRAWKKTKQYRLRLNEYIDKINTPLESLNPFIPL